MTRYLGSPRPRRSCRQPDDPFMYYQGSHGAKTLPKAYRRKCLGLSLPGQDCHHSGKPHGTVLEAKTQTQRKVPQEGPTTQFPRRGPGQRPPSRVTDSVTAHLEPQPWMSSSLKETEKGGGKGRAWPKSRGGRKHKTIKEKKIQPRPGVGSGHRHCRPSWDGTAEAPQGYTQLHHHSQRPCDPEGVLTHLVRPPSSLPSIFSGRPQDDCP